MKCSKCGTEIPKDAMFCPNCGEKKKKPIKKILIATLLILVFIAVAAAVIFFVKTTKDKENQHMENLVIYSSNGNQFINMEGAAYSPNEIYEVYYNREKELTVYVDSEDDCLNLYYIKKDMNPISIAKNICSAYMSVTGEHVVYTTCDDGNPSKTTLYIYSIDKDKSNKIDTDVYPYQLALSPSGKTVSYLKDYEGEEDNCLYVGGVSVKSKKIDKDGCFPVALTDNGNNLYYINTNNKFYLYDGKDSRKILIDVDNVFWFNRGVNEVLFTKENHTYYFTPKMDEPVKIANYEMNSYLTSDDSNYSVNYVSDYAYLIERSSLKNALITGEDVLLWLNTDATDTVKVASIYGNNYQLAENEKSFLYVKNSSLYKASNFAGEIKDELICGDIEVEYFIASKDLSLIYLVTEDNELYYLKGKNKVEKISTDIQTDNSIPSFNESTRRIYYIEDNKLYSAAKNMKSVEMLQEDTGIVYSFANGVIYITLDDYDYNYYYLKDKEPVKLFSYTDN